MSDDESVIVSSANDIVTVTINRPKRKNAIDEATWDKLRKTFDEIGSSGEHRVMVLTGAGGDFCAGADLAADRGDLHPIQRMREIHKVGALLHEIPIPTIAQVSGVAVGAGLNLALGCDLVVADRTARFSEIFVKRALSLDLGGSWLLPRIVGIQQAKRLALLGEIIDAAEAERIGLVTYVVDPDELDAKVADLAGQLAAGPPIALTQTKVLLNESFQTTMREALESEVRTQAVNFATEDTAAAFAAFLNKTEPKFTGRWR